MDCTELSHTIATYAVHHKTSGKSSSSAVAIQLVVDERICRLICDFRKHLLDAQFPRCTTNIGRFVRSILLPSSTLSDPDLNLSILPLLSVLGERSSTAQGPDVTMQLSKSSNDTLQRLFYLCDGIKVTLKLPHTVAVRNMFIPREGNIVGESDVPILLQTTFQLKTWNTSTIVLRIRSKRSWNQMKAMALHC